MSDDGLSFSECAGSSSAVTHELCLCRAIKFDIITALQPQSLLLLFIIIILETSVKTSFFISQKLHSALHLALSLTISNSVLFPHTLFLISLPFFSLSFSLFFHSYRVLSVSADSLTAAAGVNETVSDDVYLYR